MFVNGKEKPLQLSIERKDNVGDFQACPRAGRHPAR
jgi:hypothetical protein